jgi:hypothetical protein
MNQPSDRKPSQQPGASDRTPDQGQLPQRDRSNVDDAPGNARDREMGRGGEPQGDRGQGQRSWTPPAGEQGISNRPDDDDPEPGSTSHGA